MTVIVCLHAPICESVFGLPGGDVVGAAVIVFPTAVVSPRVAPELFVVVCDGADTTPLGVGNHQDWGERATRSKSNERGLRLPFLFHEIDKAVCKLPLCFRKDWRVRKPLHRHRRPHYN